MTDGKVITAFFHNKVDTLKEFKDVEQRLFSLEYSQPLKVSVYCVENNTVYFYKTQKVKGHLLMVTDGEYTEKEVEF
jgi:hypothetical protein